MWIVVVSLSLSIKKFRNNTDSNFLDFPYDQPAMYDIIIRSLCDTLNFVPVLFEVFVSATINCVIVGHENETVCGTFVQR